MAPIGVINKEISLTKIAKSGSESVSQRYGSAYPDPYPWHI
jgi:hypothetical protein